MSYFTRARTIIRILLSNLIDAHKNIEQYLKRITHIQQNIYQKNVILNAHCKANIAVVSSQDYIEPHKQLLTKPNNGTLLYKIIPSYYFFDMLKNDYLYFRRVDSYNDDKNDSIQPNREQEINEKIGFEKNPEFKASDYYNNCRSRTYACCFSTEDTTFLWNHYNKGDNNAVRLVFDCYKLINYLNGTHPNAKIIHRNMELKNFFYINYGLVKYGNLQTDILSQNTPPNPIEYIYFKDFDKYAEEKEFRISLATHGIYKKYVLPDHSTFDFPISIEYKFNFKYAVNSGVIVGIDVSDKYEKKFLDKLKSVLKQKNIVLT